MGTKHHRLPRECYIGRIAVSFTLCLEKRDPFFVQPNLVRLFIDLLKKVGEKHHFFAIYCFMPEHLHLIFLGCHENTHLLQALEDFKQATGYFLAKHYSETKWEKSFHDRILRSKELGAHLRYVLDNPVRRGLVGNWREYQFSGAIGLDLEALLENLATE